MFSHQHPQQMQHESMNMSSISTHRLQQQQQQQVPYMGGLGSNAATMAHAPVSAQVLHDLARQTATGTGHSANVSVAATGAASAPTTTTAAADDGKEHQRQQIINHVNALIEYCAIPQKNKSERITSVRQCSSSFFVLLCQRLFDTAIPGIDIYPNTPEKKRNNVELVLQELQKHDYPVHDIAAEAVVQLDETHLSRLIMVFVRIAEADGMRTGIDADRSAPAAGYTIAEVPTGGGGVAFPTAPPTAQRQAHHVRQGAVGASAHGLEPAAGDVSAALPPPPSAAPIGAGDGLYAYPHGNGEGFPPTPPDATAYFHSQHHHHYHNHQQLTPQQQQQQHLLSSQGVGVGVSSGGYYAGGGEVYAPNAMHQTGESGHEDDEEQPSSGYEEDSHVRPGEGGSLADEDDDMLTRQEFVASWQRGIRTPSEDSKLALLQRKHRASPSQSHKRRVDPSALLAQEVRDVQMRIQASERLADESLRQRQQHTDARRKVERGSRIATDGPIPTPSSSLTATTPPSAHRARKEAGVTGTDTRASDRGDVRRQHYGQPHESLAKDPQTQQPAQMGDAARQRRPPVHPLPLDEPPLTRVECRLLASHPNRLIDAEARDEKIERLRAARFLGEAQTRLRQRMRNQYDTALADLREELKATLKLSQGDKRDLMRRVRDENSKYRDAYAALMESAANDNRVPRHLMSSHTAQHAEFYSASLRESRRMCEYLQQENDRRNLAELAQYVKTTSEWQRRMPV